MTALTIKYSLLLFLTILVWEVEMPKRDNKKSTKYILIQDWLQLPKDYRSGQVSGIGIDVNQDIVFFQRTNRQWSYPFPDSIISSNTVFTADRLTGKIIGSWGANFFIMPHGLTVDNDNHIWVTDVALQQVFKFTHEGKLLMTIGQAKTAGNDSAHFNLPTDVAVANDGSFYVSDGYENSRIVKFSKEGHYLFEWGKKGGGEGEFDVPHSIALDKNGNIYVADRENNRIQKFNGRGKFLKEFKNSEASKLYAVYVGKSDDVFAIDDLYVNDTLPFGDGVMKFNSKMKLKLRFGRNNSTVNKFDFYHDIIVDDDENIYVANIGGGTKVQKFKKISK